MTDRIISKDGLCRNVWLSAQHTAATSEHPWWAAKMMVKLEKLRSTYGSFVFEDCISRWRLQAFWLKPHATPAAFFAPVTTEREELNHDSLLWRIDFPFLVISWISVVEKQKTNWPSFGELWRLNGQFPRAIERRSMKTRLKNNIYLICTMNEFPKYKTNIRQI